MEVLSFYWTNIIAGCVLVFVLGHVGRHLVARNQSMEIMLLGQEFQTSILMAALLIGMVETGAHDDHSFHFESLVGLIFVLFYHSIYFFVIKKYRTFRIEGAICSILLLMGISHMVVLLSPVVEFHMVKSYLGDIVTVSKSESILVIFASVILFGVFVKFQKNIMLDTIEISIFNAPTKTRDAKKIFGLLVVLLMLFSIHLFGTIFTVGAMIIPALITGILNVHKKQFNTIVIFNSFSVITAFFFLLGFDRFPTTVIILFLIFITTIVLSLIFRK